MINETFLYSAIISTVLGLGVFYIFWRYLLLIPYTLSESWLTTTGGTMLGDIQYCSMSVSLTGIPDSMIQTFSLSDSNSGGLFHLNWNDTC